MNGDKGHGEVGEEEMSAVLFGLWLLLAPDLPDLLGQCDVVQRFDGLDDKWIVPVPRLPGFDGLCTKAREAIGLGGAGGAD